jgi:hypothetical protein
MDCDFVLSENNYELVSEEGKRQRLLRQKKEEDD